mmetsp:Transcript_31346/g.61890  ORF Transcript_31346/g.61890 Transcript_31346/m.61890 type:complete len:105 (+) Transcript_31346:84-398(+)
MQQVDTAMNVSTDERFLDAQMRLEAFKASMMRSVERANRKIDFLSKLMRDRASKNETEGGDGPPSFPSLFVPPNSQSFGRLEGALSALRRKSPQPAGHRDLEIL